MSIKNEYDLTSGQKALWFIHALGGTAQSVYNESLIYSLNGSLSVDVLQNTVNTLLEKHPMLRAGFDQDNFGNLLQRIDNQTELKVSVINDIAEANLADFISQEIARPFDLKKAPLMHISLIRKGATEHLLLIVIHHIIMDGISIAILMNDFNKYYNYFAKGFTDLEYIVLPNYVDCVRAERLHCLSQEYADKVNALVETLKGYSGLNFLPSPVSSSDKNDIFVGDRVYFNLDAKLYSRVIAFAKANRCTIFNFLLAAYNIFISQYAQTQDIVVGVPFANRAHNSDRTIVGYYANALPVRILLNPKQSFTELLSHIRKIAFSYLGKQEVAFEHIADKLDIERKAPGQHPLIQALFTWSPTVDALKLSLENITTQLEHHYFSKTAKFDLSLSMLERNNQSVLAYFEYRTSLFDRAMVETFATGFQSLIKNILNTPSDSISSLRFMDECEEDRLREKFFINNFPVIVKKSLVGRFSDVSRQFSKKAGLILADKNFSYETLAALSDQWAGYIRSKYADNFGSPMPVGTLIAICLDRHEDMIFAILGILKAGGAYVPIDPRFPKDRIDYIVSDSNSALLLTHRQYMSLNIQFEANRIIYMDDESIQTNPDFQNPAEKMTIDAKNPAYVIYTSGSTGKPKGVLITHENVICLFESVKKQANFSNEDRWSLFHTYCFDVSVWEMWGAFLFGGTLVIIPYEASRDPKKFYQLLSQEKITVLTQTPLAFQMVLHEDMSHKQKLKQLRYVFFAGESLKVSSLKHWISKYTTTSPFLINMYGATEATIHTTYKLIQPEDLDSGRDNIGKALDAFSMCIMDENLAWCPVGVVGEICIGGRGLAQGYLNREELTRQKFVKNPYASFLGPGEETQLYKTGDLGRLMPDGSIEYLGRKDFQVKLRGFRIELGEIESALGRFNNIFQSIVLLKGEAESAYLSAYYTVKPNEHVDESMLMLHLKSLLPEYMLPKILTALDTFPITVNGKIDRNALLQRNDKHLQEVHYQQLNTELEHDIAAIWAEVLKIDINDVGLLSNFFDLGGNSLLVVKMLMHVSRKLGRDLPINKFMAEPTVKTLSGNHQTVAALQNRSAFIDRLQKEATLSPTIQPLTQTNPRLSSPDTILLTGATGFVGAHILNDLLKNTPATKIYCLIRAPSLAIASLYLDDKLTRYRLFDARNQARVIPVLAHLNQERLGLSEENYNKLADEVDVILHVGAHVNHILDFNTLYQTNVLSTLELLRLATQVKNKAIHFVSTLAVSTLDPLRASSSANDETDISFLNNNGYLTTKWVSEQLLYAAFERGIAAHVYRPGNVIAGENDVYEAENNHTLLRLKGFLQLGKVYVGQSEYLEMMPVDLLSAAIVKLMLSRSQFTYNLNNSKIIFWKDYLLMANAQGYLFDWIDDANEWNEILNQLDESNALYKLSWLYKTSSSKIHSCSKRIDPDYVICTPSYEDMIKRQIKVLSLIGFLEKPIEKCLSA